MIFRARDQICRRNGSHPAPVLFQQGRREALADERGRPGTGQHDAKIRSLQERRQERSHAAGVAPDELLDLLPDLRLLHNFAGCPLPTARLDLLRRQPEVIHHHSPQTPPSSASVPGLQARAY